jgi:hypothetical protein
MNFRQFLQLFTTFTAHVHLSIIPFYPATP